MHELARQRGIGQGSDVVVGQDDPGAGFHMRREDRFGTHFADLRHHLFDGGRRIGRPRIVAGSSEITRAKVRAVTSSGRSVW